MATTSSGLTFYEEQFETGVYQGLTQMVDGFNGASQGTILMTAGARKGRKPEAQIFAQLTGLIQSRDPSGSGTKAATTLSNNRHGQIKLFDTAPLAFTSQDWKDMGLDNETGTRIFGIAYGQQMAGRMLNSVIAALVGGIQAVGATAINDYSATGAFDYPQLNIGLGKLGDARQNARTLVAYSQPLTDLLGTSYTAQQIAFQFGTGAIYNGGLPTLGMFVLNTDAAPLFVDNTGTDHYWTLALVPGAATVKTGPSNTIFSVVTGTVAATPENQTWLLSTETEFEIELRGVGYKSTSGDNPNDAALATSSNWETVGTADVKRGPGVAIKTQ